jgi:hypothetical protein
MNIVSMLTGAVKDVATATPEKRAIIQASLMNLQYNLSTYPGLLRDISQLYHLLTDEAQAEVMQVVSLTMGPDDYEHVQAIFSDYRV